jgi:hypothetical protein
MEKHLWEIKHHYYCNEDYYARESVETSYKNWADFMGENGDADFDYNLVFRFDWREGEDHDLIPYNGDANYRNGKLLIFWMGQRKGLYRYSTVEVCRNDEPAVLEFLRARWEHLKLLWSPLGETP